MGSGHTAGPLIASQSGRACAGVGLCPRKCGGAVQGRLACRAAVSAETPAPKLAFIDTYDSFTYTLVQYLGELGVEPVVYRNDEVKVADLAGYDGIVISPGPGTPEEAGISTQAIRELSWTVAILGVCLGHQCLGQALGGQVVRNEPSHGTTPSTRPDHPRLPAGTFPAAQMRGNQHPPA